MASKLRTNFISPPKGGNSRGVPTQSSMGKDPTDGPAPTLEQWFTVGKITAISNKVEPHRVLGTPITDFRNRRRSEIDLCELADDKTGTEFSDSEMQQEGTGCVEDKSYRARPLTAQPKPVLDPPAANYRSDGKKFVPMK